MADKKNFCPKFEIYSPLDLSKPWFVYWYQDGKRKKKFATINQHNTYETRMVAAQRVILELKAKYRPRTMDMRMALQDWLDRKKRSWKRKSWLTYESILEVFFDHIGNRKINKDRVEEFFDFLYENRTGTTYNKYRQKLGQMLAAVGHGDLLEDIDSIQEIRTPARYFQKHQIVRLKNYIYDKDPELWLFVQFMYYCFIRPGELRFLRAGDILIDEWKILMRGEISKNRKNQYIVIPKPFRSSLDLVTRLSPREYIFPSKLDQSKPMGMNTMAGRHRKVLRELGFTSEYKLYSWKHTGAVMAVKNGIGVKQLQLQLRHHSLDQVNAYLRQMGVQDMTDVVERFPGI